MLTPVEVWFNCKVFIEYFFIIIIIYKLYVTYTTVEKCE